MITNFKIFENEEDNEPKIGDYVIIEPIKLYYLPDRQSIYEKMANNIYKIIDSNSDKSRWKINYKSGWWVSRVEIAEYSENKEELELKMQTKKYNL